MKLQKELRNHQWKAFRRHPMFERNMGVKIFMFLMFGILGMEFLTFGFFLDKLLLEVGTYTRAIDAFNACLLYLFLGDFLIKFFFKRSSSMQIAPYLSLPVERNKLFDFLLVKEFSNVWNMYLLFLVVPFAFKSITPYYNVGTAFLYIIFIYLLCVANSFLVRIIDDFFKRNFLLTLIPIAAVAAVFYTAFGLDVHFGKYTQLMGEELLNNNVFFWLGLLLLMILLRIVSRSQMRGDLYREMQGVKEAKVQTFSSLSFLDKFGDVGDAINMEIKMILRSKRLKNQLFSMVFMILYGFFLIYKMDDMIQHNLFFSVFWFTFMMGGLGLIMGQYLFMTESSSFDGFMARNYSMSKLLRAKYILYSAYAFVVALLLLIPVFQGKISLLLVVSAFFFVIGPIFCMIFQNAVYNKSPLDLFESGMFNWKGTSSSMLMITLITMFVPVVFIMIIGAVFSSTTAYYVMLVVGLAFTLTSNVWMEWTYKRFMKRRYKNMEGFRSNG